MSRQVADRSREVRGGHAHPVRRVAIGVSVLVALGATITAMMLSSRPTSSDETRRAPDFSLVDTSGARHSLEDHRGENLLLYFSEGAGCQSCIVQMGEIEKHAEEFADQDVTVLPIVMNTREQITADMAANGVRTPFLLDDGTVSAAYGTLGRGMHAGLPGHSFVLIDAEGRQRWYGEYPSMWLAPQDLLEEIRSRLS
ncbi:peroxiredoxin family protein [Nocardioides sp.]|uniref:peroxiredoxin family protein n=1 Tax=Nocardioides sp. TaxID=35761 RepID=UPI002ED90493